MASSAPDKLAVDVQTTRKHWYPKWILFKASPYSGDYLLAVCWLPKHRIHAAGTSSWKRQPKNLLAFILLETECWNRKPFIFGRHITVITCSPMISLLPSVEALQYCMYVAVHVMYSTKHRVSFHGYCLHSKPVLYVA
jgi:hypothetical protein